MLLAITAATVAQAPTQWAQNPSRNNVVQADDLPDHLGDDNRLWDVELHNRKFFNIVTIDDGRVYCGVSSDNLPERMRSRGAAMFCLELETGKVIWQTEVSERGGGYGLSTAPVIDGDRLYVRGSGDIYCLNKYDGTRIWKSEGASQEYFNQMHGSHGTGMVIGDYFWTPTGHATGSDCENWVSNSWESPFHPNIVVLDKHTGKLVAQDDVAMGPHQHGSWGSISMGEVNGRKLVFWGDAAGWVHAYEVPDRFEEGEVSTLKEVWRCDANPESYRRTEDGTALPYAAYMGGFGPKDIGPCEIISTPVLYEGKLYVSLGRDKAYSPAQGRRRFGDGAVVCIDPSGEGDVTDTHKLWANTDVMRTFCTPSIVGDLLFIADHNGHVYCLDIAKQGQTVWKRDIDATIWNYWQAVGDGKLYVMNEQRDFHILSADREGKELFAAEMDTANNPQAGMTDGILIVATRRGVTAYGGPEYMKTHKPMAGGGDRKPIEGDTSGGH
jgi:outer membrane protein assembly factor BamB